jgi:erythromycin esterase-like protein
MSASLANAADGDLAALEAIRREARPLTGERRDYDAVLARIADARIVLIGEASHGSHEFYRERARITKRLISELGFGAVAIAAFWPDAYRVNRYVQGAGPDHDAEEALRSFQRFPSWMWRNTDMLSFVDWLHAHNAHHKTSKVAFYGLDLYGLSGSMGAVIDFLDAHDVGGAERARARYECLQSFAEDSTGYGRAVLRGLSDPNRAAVVARLAELRRARTEQLAGEGMTPADERFFAAENVRVEAAAEDYYSTIFGDRAASWNLRHEHLADTLDHLVAHLDSDGNPARVVVWAHNSHVGNARGTDMATRGELSLGQLLRERHGDAVVSIGFTTYAGSVTAASRWGGPAERKHVRRALDDSHEALLHETHLPGFLLCPLAGGDAGQALRPSRLERAIGVIYRPDTERASHYFYGSLTDQFDVLVHIDSTRAVEPLERSPSWNLGESPETNLSAL